MSGRSLGHDNKGTAGSKSASERSYMICVGIDAASTKHDVFIATDYGQVISDVFQIKNSKSDYDKLYKIVQKVRMDLKDDEVRIGIESTGIYSFNLLDYFSKKEGIKVILINPSLTNMFQLSQSVHYAKTDKIDAKGICLYISRISDFLTYTPQSYHSSELKALYREIDNLNKEMNVLKNRLHSFLHKSFPEIFDFSIDIDSQYFLNMLVTHPSPKKIKGIHVGTLIKMKGKPFDEESAKAFKETAKNTVGTYSEAESFIVSQLASLILMMEKQKQNLVKQIKPIIDKQYPYLLDIAGVSYISAAGFVGEIGEIANYRNADSLLAFAGLDLIVYQSGKYEGKQNRLSKRGSSYLRNAIHNATMIMVRYNPVFKDYFQKKMSEGKTYMAAIASSRKKLVRLLYTVLKNKKYIEPTM